MTPRPHLLIVDDEGDVRNMISECLERECISCVTAASVEEAIAAASGYPELAQEVKAVESRLTERPQLELFSDLAKQRRVRAVDAVRGSLRAADRALTEAKEQGRVAFNAFMARLRAFRVLDPACGSGNFLYLALVELKNVERRVAICGRGEAAELAAKGRFALPAGWRGSSSGT